MLFIQNVRVLFTHIETSTLPVKGCRFELYSALMAIAQWGSLTCHAYCDIWHLFIMVISVDSCRSHLLQRSAVKLSLPVLMKVNNLMQLGFEHQNLRMRSKHTYRFHFTAVMKVTNPKFCLIDFSVMQKGKEILKKNTATKMKKKNTTKTTITMVDNGEILNKKFLFINRLR